MQPKRYYYITNFFFSMATMGTYVLTSYYFREQFKATPLQISWFAIAMSIAYVIFAPLMGHFSSRLNNKWMMTVGCVSMSLTAFIPFAANGEYWFYYLVAFGICFSFSASMFYPNMIGSLGQSASIQGISRQIGFFNLGWITPAIFAPVLSGYILDSFSRAMFPVVGSMGIIAALISLKIHRLEKHAELSPRKQIQLDPEERALLPAGGLLFMLLAWFAVLMVRSSIGGIIFPHFGAHAQDLGLSALRTGWLFCAMAITQAVLYLCMSRLHFWHFRLSLFYIPAITMIVGLGLLSVTENFYWMIGIFVLFGITGAITYNASIFYCLVVSTNKIRAGGIHEGMLSAGTILTVFAAGHYQQVVGHRSGAYQVGILFCCIFLLVISTTTAVIIRNRKRRNLPAADE